MPSLMHGQQHAPDFAVLRCMPFRSELELGALRQAPGNARLHAVNVLRDWGLRHLEAAERGVGWYATAGGKVTLGAGARASHRRGIAQ
jgi:hypothetical protein